jgi:steroid 5-alpha reductase family enzyme
MMASKDTSAGARARGLGALFVAYSAALAVALGVGFALRARHPLLVTAAADAAATLVVFAFSVRHDNSSVYDPYWSVAPVPIALYWASLGEGGARRAAVLVLVCAWAARLTANQLARWGGLGDEDFRYAELRARSGRWYWPLSLIGVHLLPSAWVFLGLLPIFPVLAGPARPLGALDVAALAVAGGAVLLEAAADLQLRRFRRARRDPEAVLDSGLWALSRHPNYLGEILFWWGLWLAGVSAAPSWSWTAVGPLAITLLFVFVSIPWMDRRMASRHAAFAERLRAIPALLPFPRRTR